MTPICLWDSMHEKLVNKESQSHGGPLAVFSLDPIF